MANADENSAGLQEHESSTETVHHSHDVSQDVSQDDVIAKIRICLALRGEAIPVTPNAVELYRILFTKYAQQMRFREAMICLNALRTLGETPSQATIAQISSVTNVDLIPN